MQSLSFVVPNGMPLSVFRDKYARRKPEGGFESWEERITAVIEGNFALAPGGKDIERALDLAQRGVMPLSGRHLQHGDLTQPSRTAEHFMNCATAMFSWASFLLLMKGCGVGRDFSSDICFVNWNYLPECRFVLAGPDASGKGGHQDYEPWIESLEEAQHKYGSESESVRWFVVDDSAEGWAKVVLVMETAAYHKRNTETLFVFDFSNVRPRGAPVAGQQGRPASGPVPLIKALHRVMSIKGAGMPPWKQALFIDHVLAACVVTGGVRRAARIAIKSCYDRDVIEFIDIKRGGHLWSANNSIGVDAEFWRQAANPRPSHCRRVFEAAVQSSYWDDTGEPGFLNLDMINSYTDGLEDITADNYISKRVMEQMGGLHPRTYDMIEYHLLKFKARKYKFVTNPCGEISLSAAGGFCDIADVCLAHADSLEDAMTACRLTAQALVRVNTMDSIYRSEVLRTNRIGVGLTGIHEFAWQHFKLTFRDLLDVKGEARKFWSFVDEMRNAVEHAADIESRRVKLPPPATYTCVKPSGTISKVMACTEGAHLPAQRYYLRWTMTAKNGPVVIEHSKRGYPTKDISHRYADTVVIGFPTCLPLVEQMPYDSLVTANEATPDEQYAWLKLLEVHWLGPDKRNNQVSYTLKWDKDVMSYENYLKFVLEHQPHVRCCALMPEVKQGASVYGYIPEEAITKETYDDIKAKIDSIKYEIYDGTKLECESGVCPIEADIHELSAGAGAFINEAGE
jgi:adenosylcobalamin-dependent ribonucleoside-triphosphate reductase